MDKVLLQGFQELMNAKMDDAEFKPLGEIAFNKGIQGTLVRALFRLYAEMQTIPTAQKLEDGATYAITVTRGYDLNQIAQLQEHLKTAYPNIKFVILGDDAKIAKIESVSVGQQEHSEVMRAIGHGG